MAKRAKAAAGENGNGKNVVAVILNHEDMGRLEAVGAKLAGGVKITRSALVRELLMRGVASVERKSA